MTLQTSYTCPDCGSIHNGVLTELFMLVCTRCGELIHLSSSKVERANKSIMPEDWSFVKIGSRGGYGEKTFTVVGRVRLQLQNDYKNFWCIALADGSHLWMMESFASFCIFGPHWNEYTGKLKKLYAGATSTISGDVKLTGEYVERCEKLSIEGEIAKWDFLRPGFFVIQCSNSNGNTALFTIDKNERQMEFLYGGKVPIEELKLTNIHEWPEWK